MYLAPRQLAGSWAFPWAEEWDSWVEAAKLVDDPNAALRAAREDAEDPTVLEEPDGLDIAQESFGRAGRFRELASLCRAIEDRSCTGVAEYFAGDLEAAIPDLEAGYEQVEASGDTFDPGLRFTLAVAREAAGDADGAMAGYADTAGDDQAAGGLRARAAMRAGDLRLDADPAAAVAWYDLALAALDANGLTRDGDYHGWMATALGARGLAAVIRNDRAVARLRALQPAADAPPDCADGEARARCELAREDAAAAAAVDPERAAFWMNVGWSARLLGDAAAARTALEMAVGLDPTLYPAFNDLGVLLAADGDLAGGRAAFAAAMSAAPDYGLARWNAGIADLADWPAGLIEGQLTLADAIARDRSLASAALDYRTDERTYRFSFETGAAVPEGGAIGRSFSIGAVVLAGAASVATLAQLPATMAGGALTTTSSDVEAWLERRTRSVHWRSRVRRIRRRTPVFGRPWLPWLGVLATVAVVTGVQAAQASPAVAAAAVTATLVVVALAFAMPAMVLFVAARLQRGRLIPAAWAPGAAVAVLSLPFQAASGPFPGARIRSPAGGHRRAWRLHLVAPLVGALVGLLAYLAFLVEPLPILRLATQVELAAVAYALLPVRPLDGWVLHEQRPRLHLVLGLAVVAVAAAFSVGIL